MVRSATRSLAALILSVCSLMMACGAGAPAIAQSAALPLPQIAWRVENPFRFFTDATDTEVHRATFLALPPADQLQRPILAAEQALSVRHDVSWAETMFRDTCWNSDTNQFVCKDGRSYINPTSHRAIFRITNIDEAAGLSCTWLTAPRSGPVRGDAVTLPCSEEVRFDIPYPSGARVTVEIGGREVAAEDVQVKDLLVVGMGDSFASGEGNPDLPVRFSRDRSSDYGTHGGVALNGYPARIGPWKQIGDKGFVKENSRWLDQACHRSLYSHQLRAAMQLAVEDDHRSVTYVGVACSGSEVTYGLFLKYAGNEWVPNPTDMSQISAIAAAQCEGDNAPTQDLPEAYHMNGAIPELRGGLVLRKCDAINARKIDLMFVSVGGNDVGFSRLLANSVLDDASTLRMLGGWFGQVHGLDDASLGLEALIKRYKSLNRALHYLLHIPWEQSDRILLTAYPGLALQGDGVSTCPDGAAGMDVLPDFKFSESKARIGTWVADKLHVTMKKAADQYGWSFVDSHRREFIGRGICAGNTTDGTRIADDLRLPRKTADGWRPYNPADYRPYVPRQRWFRTPNDSFMTGNFHVAPSLLQKVLKLDAFAWVQLLLAATYSGAFHPTAEGQAAIADAVAHRARTVLQKYGQGTEKPALAATAPSMLDETGAAASSIGPGADSLLIAPGGAVPPPAPIEQAPLPGVAPSGVETPAGAQGGVLTAQPGTLKAPVASGAVAKAIDAPAPPKVGANGAVPAPATAGPVLENLPPVAPPVAPAAPNAAPAAVPAPATGAASAPAPAAAVTPLAQPAVGGALPSSPPAADAGPSLDGAMGEPDDAALTMPDLTLPADLLNAPRSALEDEQGGDALNSKAVLPPSSAVQAQ
ncbi:hypothetical protein [Hyphomicrobium sp. D-2]|uniref:hypothetical protein n=1 Tax=Hyphomicrobium sp. D-2 TaxID=3041621 RepID=UPI002458D896|nr:hypothetical protein [Hyphomicrobium sp. D-2]MDH4982848.1 hypothetical protein [Hyphomicrobium sp. D-2]